MPTTRERLESAVAELRSLTNELGNKVPSPTEAHKINTRADTVRCLTEQIKGEATVDALAGRTAGPFAGLDANALGGTGGGHTAKALAAPGSLGAPPLAFTETDLKELQSAASERRALTKTVDSSTAPMANAAVYALSPFPWLRDQVRVLDLIPAENTTASVVTYFRATAAASAAAPVAEGGVKPESAPTWTSVQAPARKIAHYAKVTDETVADFAQFLNVVGTEMLAGLIDAENDQLLNGTNVAPQQQGLLTATGIQTRVLGADTRVDAIFKATNDLRTGSARTEPDVIVLHPDDWGDVALAKDTTGRYVAGDPFSGGPSTLWGVPVVVTTRITAGTAMVANLKLAAKAYIREAPRFEVNPLGGETEWKSNLTLLRAEERLAVAVPYPAAVVKLTGL